MVGAPQDSDGTKGSTGRLCTAWEYQPGPRGLEAKIAEKMAFLRKLDDEAS